MVENKVDLVCMEHKGRCLTAKQGISQGEILFIWKPYIVVPYVTRKDRVCANCMYFSKVQTHSAELITCREGCTHVCYCSTACEQQHWDEFHRYECSFLNQLFDLQAYGFTEEVVNYARVVMRMLTKRFQEILGQSYDVSFEDIWPSRSHFDQFSMEKHNEFQTVAKLLTGYVLNRLVSHLTEYNREFVHCVQSFLPDNPDASNVKIDDLDCWLARTADVYALQNDPTTDEATASLLRKVYILICMEEINALFHITFSFEGYSQPPQTYAMGMYPSAALVNHSCSPNLARFPVQEKTADVCVGDVVYFATRAIGEGEELCYSYLEREYTLYIKELIDADEIVQNQAKRKQQLTDEFFFDCDCARCFHESNGELDTSFMALVKQLKCPTPNCKGWLIASFKKYMICEACRAAL